MYVIGWSDWFRLLRKTELAAGAVNVKLVDAPAASVPLSTVPNPLGVAGAGVVAEMSNVPLVTTPLDWEIEPLPLSASVAPVLMVVRPV